MRNRGQMDERVPVEEIVRAAEIYVEMAVDFLR
jgi:hypothetical protein